MSLCSAAVEESSYGLAVVLDNGWFMIYWEREHILKGAVISLWIKPLAPMNKRLAEVAYL